MKEKKQVNSYRAPECQLVPVGTSYLMQTSFPNSGGHKKADDDGELNAKQGWFDEDEEEEAPQQWGI